MPGTLGTATPAPGELRIERLDRLGRWAPAWDELVASAALPSPFLRSWWVEHAAGPDRCILVVTERGRLVGGAAFELDRVRRGPLSIERVRMSGQGVLAPDHLDLVAAPDRHLEVARLVVGWLRRPGSRVLDLDGLAGTGTLAQVFAPWTVSRTLAPRATLGTDVADYLSRRPGRLRSTISRTERRLARDGASSHVVEPDGAEQALEALAQLHDGRWQDESRFLRAWARFRDAALAGIATGDVVVHELRDAHGAVVATECDLVLGDTVSFYQAGRRTEREWRGAGSVLRAHVARWAVEQGASTYDLLRGEEGYKADWADDDRELVHCRVGIGPLGRSVLLLERVRGRMLSRAPSPRDRSAPAEPPG